jgi:hypothetical protein
MRQRKSVIIAIAIVMALVLAACGTRLKDSAFQARGGQVSANGANGSTLDQTPGVQTAVTDQSGNPINPSGSTGTTPSGAKLSGSSATTPSGGVNPSGGGPANGASDIGVTADSIRIGNITSIGGSLGPNAFGVTLNGLRIFASAINDQGGINGRKVQLTTCDDASDGTRFLSCAQRLVQNDKVFALIANNSDASASSAKYEYDHGVPDLGFPLNNGYYKYPNMYSIYGVGYKRDGKTVAENGNLEQPTGIYRYFKQKVGVSKAAVFYYVIPVSKQTGCFTEAGLLKEGVPTVYEGGGGDGNSQGGDCPGAGENPAAPAFDSDVINMRSRSVDTVFDAMDVSANQRLCEAMDRQGFKVKAKVSTIVVWGEVVKQFQAPNCRNSVYIGGSSAPYSDSSNPMVARFQADRAKYGARYPQHQWTIEGWALGMEFAEGVKSLGANVTRKGFMAWLNNLKDYTLNGLFTPLDWQRVDYTKDRRDCNVVVQWQDSVSNYVTKAGTDSCVLAPYVHSKANDDGS